jgi:hypothetical protein
MVTIDGLVDRFLLLAKLVEFPRRPHGKELLSRIRPFNAIPIGSAPFGIRCQWRLPLLILAWAAALAGLGSQKTIVQKVCRAYELENRV